MLGGGLLRIVLLVVLIDGLFKTLCEIVWDASWLRRWVFLGFLAVNSDFTRLVAAAGAEGSLALLAWRV